MTKPEESVRAVIDQIDREVAFELLVKLVAEYGWLAGRPAEEVVPLVRSACYQEELQDQDSK